MDVCGYEPPISLLAKQVQAAVELWGFGWFYVLPAESIEARSRIALEFVEALCFRSYKIIYLRLI